MVRNSAEHPSRSLAPRAPQHGVLVDRVPLGLLYARYTHAGLEYGLALRSAARGVRRAWAHACGRCGRDIGGADGVAWRGIERGFNVGFVVTSGASAYFRAPYSHCSIAHNVRCLPSASVRNARRVLFPPQVYGAELLALHHVRVNLAALCVWLARRSSPRHLRTDRRPPPEASRTLRV